MWSRLASMHQPSVLPFAGGALGLGIFVLDTLGPLDSQ